MYQQLFCGELLEMSKVFKNHCPPQQPPVMGKQRETLIDGGGTLIDEGD